jgi:uncharacterized protein YraI
MSPAPLSERLTTRLTAVALLLLVLLSAAVHGTAVSAYDLLPIGRQAEEPSIFVTAAVEVRSGPGSDYLTLTAVQPGEQYALLGRSTDGRWWRIDFCGQPAWLPAASARAHDAALVATVTVVSTN